MYSLLCGLLSCLSLLARAADVPVINSDFPDPSILQDVDGTWYAFATVGGDRHLQVQVARAPAPHGPWTKLDANLLPRSGPFFTGRNTYAPDVRIMGDGTYVLYYSGEVASSPHQHCVGVGVSRTILGPYAPREQPLVCDLSVGGQIDQSGFHDVDGKRYIMYKNDGNTIGPGGDCNNGRDPRVSTDIMLQEVAQNGIDKIGGPIKILDRIGTETLVEAPFVYRHVDGTYVLFFSTDCFNSPNYDIRYATAESIRGPYRRAAVPVAKTNDRLGLVSPGGASSVVNDTTLVFHANCPGGRCMHVKDFVVDDGRVRLV